MVILKSLIQANETEYQRKFEIDQCLGKRRQLGSIAKLYPFNGQKKNSLFIPIGLTPLFDQNWYREHPAQASGKAVTGTNVGGALRAGVTNLNAPSMIIGAHYDHLEGIPGADDNASSVAIMIETA